MGGALLHGKCKAAGVWPASDVRLRSQVVRHFKACVLLVTDISLSTVILCSVFS